VDLQQEKTRSNSKSQDEKDTQMEMGEEEETHCLSVNPREYYKQKYNGHCNIQTVKSVSFFGPGAEYVVSGSDDGNIFIWEKITATLVNILHGDRHVVNIMSGHPFDPVLATSGIENHVKLWHPTLSAPRDLSQSAIIFARNKTRVDASSDRPAISLIRRLIQTGALQVVQPRRPRGDNEGGDDDEQVECRIA